MFAFSAKLSINWICRIVFGKSVSVSARLLFRVVVRITKKIHIILALNMYLHSQHIYLGVTLMDLLLGKHAGMVL